MGRQYGILLILLLLALPAWADSITGGDTTLTHGSSATITGTFTAKTAAEPVMWDNFDDGAIKAQWKTQVPCSSDTADYNMAAHTGTWRSVGQAHANSSYFVAGGHDPAAYNPNLSSKGVFVMLGCDVTAPTGSYIYMSYYYRHDPSWDDGPFNNLKMADFASGHAHDCRPGVCSTWPNYDHYDTTSDGQYSDLYFEYRNVDENNATFGLHCVGPDNISTGYNIHDLATNYYPCDAGLNPPKPSQGWHRYEFIVSVGQTGDNRHLNIKIDGVDYYPYPFGTDTGIDQDVHSILIGGYFRATLSPETGDADGFRYFDDVYIDNTLQRVVLANHSTYASATIIEPQIPTAWTTGKISMTVNQGAIPDGTAYLYVIDATNTPSTAREVTVGGSSPSTSTIRSGSVRSGGIR